MPVTKALAATYAYLNTGVCMYVHMCFVVFLFCSFFVCFICIYINIFLSPSFFFSWVYLCFVVCLFLFLVLNWFIHIYINPYIADHLMEIVKRDLFDFSP